MSRQLPPLEWRRQADALYCPSCFEPLGRLTCNPLHRDAWIPISFEADQELRAVVEAQAPPRALRALLWVLPEGVTERDGVWSMTARAQRRRRYRRSGGMPIRATHGRRPSVGPVSLFAWAPALPANVICPGCGRHLGVDVDTLRKAAEHIPAELNDLAARVSHEDILARVRGDPNAHLWFPIVASNLGISDPADLPPEAGIEALRNAMPELELLLLAQQGVPITAEMFFIVELPKAMQVPIGDPELMRSLAGERWRRLARPAPPQTAIRYP